MAFFFFPEHVQIDVRFSADQALLSVLRDMIESQGDREKMSASADALDASTKALENVVAGNPSP